MNCRSTAALKTGNFETCFLNRMIMMMIVIKMTIKVSEHLIFIEHFLKGRSIRNISLLHLSKMCAAAMTISLD